MNYTGRRPHGDGDLDGDKGGKSGEGEGFKFGNTGDKGGLLVPR